MSLNDCGLYHLYNGSFQSLLELNFLDLRNNGIQYCDRGTLKGLSNLAVLFLAGNQIGDIVNFPAGIFVPLHSVEYLDLLDFNAWHYHPLENGYTFAEGFTKLNLLQTLTIPDSTFFYDDAFQYLNNSQIKWVNLSDRGFTSLLPKEFLMISRLEVLDLSDNPYLFIRTASYTGNFNELMVNLGGTGTQFLLDISNTGLTCEIKLDLFT